MLTQVVTARSQCLSHFRITFYQRLINNGIGWHYGQLRANQISQVGVTSNQAFQSLPTNAGKKGTAAVPNFLPRPQALAGLGRMWVAAPTALGQSPRKKDAQFRTSLPSQPLAQPPRPGPTTTTASTQPAAAAVAIHLDKQPQTRRRFLLFKSPVRGGGSGGRRQQ